MIGEYTQFAGLGFEIIKTAGDVARSRLGSLRNLLILDYHNNFTMKQSRYDIEAAYQKLKRDQPARYKELKAAAKEYGSLLGGQSGKAKKNKVKKVADLSGLSSSESVNRVAKISSQVMKSGYNFGGLTAHKGKLRSRLSDWLTALSDPFNTPPQKCPVNYNPMPTLQSQVFRTTCTGKVSAATNKNIQFTLFPGHTAPVDADEMDGPSYHQCWQAFNSTGTIQYTPISPMTVDDGSGATTGRNMFLSACDNTGGYGGGTVGTNSAIIDTTAFGAAVSTAALAYDVELPLIAAGKNGAHTRWKLTAMEIRFRNETPEVDRGGEFYSVQPLNTVAFNSIKGYSIFPTFRNHGICDRNEGTVKWIPKVQDLAFWHAATRVQNTNTITNAGILLWFVNTTAKTQNISYEMVFHWELGGLNVQTMATPSIQQPADSNIVVPTLSVLQSSSPTAAPAPRVAEVVSSTASANMLDRAINFVGKDNVEAAVKHIANHVGGPYGSAIARVLIPHVF